MEKLEVIVKEHWDGGFDFIVGDSGIELYKIEVGVTQRAMAVGELKMRMSMMSITPEEGEPVVFETEDIIGMAVAGRQTLQFSTRKGSSGSPGGDYEMKATKPWNAFRYYELYKIVQELREYGLPKVAGQQKSK
jgi:hypothetical protein